MDDKVIDAKDVATYSKTNGGNGMQIGFGMNIVMNERPIVLSQKVHSGV